MFVATHTPNGGSVQADIIASVVPAFGGSTLTLVSGATFFASDAMELLHVPIPADYLVTNGDGYQYLAAKDVFDRQYSVIAAPPPVDDVVDRVTFRVRLTGRYEVIP